MTATRVYADYASQDVVDHRDRSCCASISLPLRNCRRRLLLQGKPNIFFFEYSHLLPFFLASVSVLFGRWPTGDSADDAGGAQRCHELIANAWSKSLEISAYVTERITGAPGEEVLIRSVVAHKTLHPQPVLCGCWAVEVTAVVEPWMSENTRLWGQR